MDGWLPSAKRAHIWTFAPLTPSGNFGRQITKHTVIYGEYVRFWLTLFTCSAITALSTVMYSHVCSITYGQACTVMHSAFTRPWSQSQSRHVQHTHTSCAAHTYTSRTVVHTHTHTRHVRCKHTRVIYTHHLQYAAHTHVMHGQCLHTICTPYL